MARLRGLSIVVLTAIAVAACGTNWPRNPVGTVSSVQPTTGALYTQPSLELPQNNAVSAETLVVGGAIAIFGLPENALGVAGPLTTPANAALLYVIYDPLAPNWTVKEQALNADTYYLSLRAKSFRTGGDGEAIQIVKRRAMQLQREKGYSSYKILDYSEGIESSTPLTHRYSEGTIQLVRSK